MLLDGLTITNGYAAEQGVGLCLNESGKSVALVNCRIAGNQAAASGLWGVGAFIAAGSAGLTNTAIAGNSGSASYGVGLCASNATIALTDCRLAGQRDAGASGGGLHAYLGMVTCQGCDFVDNGAGASGGYGGGTYVNAASAAFRNCLWSGNTAYYYGGGLYVHGSANVLVQNATFADNETLTTSYIGGGGVHVAGGAVAITNSIFKGNRDNCSTGGGHNIARVSGNCSIGYACLDATNSPYVYGTLAWGPGILIGDPRFAAEYSDVHLRSRSGRWNGSSWVTDAVSSPCIDAGDPASDHSREPDYPAGRVNLGRYGNTPEASRGSAYVAPRGILFRFR